MDLENQEKTDNFQAFTKKTTNESNFLRANAPVQEFSPGNLAKKVNFPVFSRISLIFIKFSAEIQRRRGENASFGRETDAKHRGFPGRPREIPDKIADFLEKRYKRRSHPDKSGEFRDISEKRFEFSEDLHDFRAKGSKSLFFAKEKPGRRAIAFENSIREPYSLQKSHWKFTVFAKSPVFYAGAQ